MCSDTLSSPTKSLRRYRGAYRPHSHDFSQVLLGCEGCLDLELEDRSARVDATTGLVVPAGVAHGFRSQIPSQVWVVDAPVTFGLDRIRSFRLPAQWRANGDAMDALASISSAGRVLPRRAVEVATLASAVDARLHEAWPVSRMAALFHLSVPQFHERWRALLRVTPQAWLRARRLDRAEQLLSRGFNVEATAIEVGYASASALCAALRREGRGGARQLKR